MNQEIETTISNIEKYDFGGRNNPHYHHYRFAVPLVRPMDKYDIVLLGIAPMEKERDWTLHTGHTSETIRYNWREQTGVLDQELNEWRDLVTDLCGTDAVIQSEMFLWSTPDLGAGFKKRFGATYFNSLFLHYSRAANLELVDAVNPNLIVVRGIKNADRFARVYGLEFVDWKEGVGELYERNDRPWLFVPDWTPARVKKHRRAIQNMLAHLPEQFYQGEEITFD
jgi:hypothetical protein